MSTTPIKMKGATLLEPDGDQTQYTVTLDIKVNVPLVGGKLEGFAKGIAERQLQEEFSIGDTWIAEH